MAIDQVKEHELADHIAQLEGNLARQLPAEMLQGFQGAIQTLVNGGIAAFSFLGRAAQPSSRSTWTRQSTSLEVPTVTTGFRLARQAGVILSSFSWVGGGGSGAGGGSPGATGIGGS